MKAKVFSPVFVMLLVGSLSSLSHAQVTTNITPSGLGTTVTPTGNVYTITGGTRPGGGPNLFHSFGIFNVGAGDTANFFNNTGLTTSNILSRVTGNNPSYIFGTIQTTNFGNANLFLINPNGVIFEATAHLDVGGSFHVSTADYVRMFDGTNSAYFYANSAKDSLANSVLASAPIVDFGFLTPAALGFTNSNPASITVDAVDGAFFKVPAGQTISLVGGNRTFTRDDTGETVPAGVTITGGTLNAPSGQINLVSVASQGEVLLPTMQYAPNVNGQSFTAFGNVTLSNATLDVSDNLFEGDGHAGTVLIRGGQLVMDSASVLAQTFGIVDGARTAIDIDVRGDMTMTGSTLQSVAFDAMGGDISVKAATLSLSGGSQIVTASVGVGNSGNVAVATSGALSIDNSFILSEAFSSGNGGAVGISVGALSLNGGAIQTLAFDVGNAGALTLNVANDLSVRSGGAIESVGGTDGSAGNIMITAGGTVTISDRLDAFTFSHIFNFGGVTGGASSDISIEAGKFILADGAQIQNEALSASTGNITVHAAESATLSGGSLIRLGIRDVSGGLLEISAPTITIDQSSVRARTGGIGDAGTIRLMGDNLILSRSQVTSDSQGSGRGGDITVVANSSLSISGAFTDEFGVTFPGGILTKAFDTGNAGRVTVSAGAVTMSAGGRIDSSTAASGLGGDITLQASQVALTNGATISAQSTGTGNAGNIQITASDSLVMRNHSAITTATTQSDGGNITIQAGRLVRLTDSTITTSVQGGTGNGGNITIDPTFVILQRSQIIANAFGGNGGNILIVADMFFTDPFSVISASSTLGINGTINIQAPITNLSGTLAPLSEEFLQAAGLLRASCAARFQGGNVSSFVVAGRDGMPLETGGLLPSPLFIENSGSSRLAGSLNVPDLRVGRSFGDQDLTLAALSAGCAS